MTVTYLADASAAPRVSFAVGRRVGGAVVRNRCRRRVRAVLAELAARPETPLRPGAYLFGLGPGVVGLSPDELCHTVERALARVIATGADEPAIDGH